MFGSLSQNKPAPLFGNLREPVATSSAPGTSSLFCSPQTQLTGTPGGGSLVGALDQQKSTPSLFGNTSAAQSQPANTGGGGGLFGASTATAAPLQGGSLFGGNNNQQQNTSSNSLFPSLGASTSAPPQAGGLFGQPGASQPQSTHVGGGNSFEGFAVQKPQAPQQQQEQGQLSQQAQGDRAKSTPGLFGKLLENGRKRQNVDQDGTAFGELPSLQLGLGDIARKVRSLGQGTPTSTERQRDGDARAHYLLAASGVNTGAALRDLSSFTTDAAAKGPAPQVATLDTDLDGYVEGLYRQSSLDLVQQSLEQAKRDFDNFLEESVEMEWDSQRRRIYEHFGLAKKNDTQAPNGSLGASARGSFGTSSRRSRALGASAAASGFAGSISKSVLGAPSTRGARPTLFNDVAEKAGASGMQPAPEDRMLREKQDKYAEKVRSLNVARLQETTYPVLLRFADVESQPSVEVLSNPFFADAMY